MPSATEMCNGVDTIPQESVPYDNQGSDLYNDIFLYHITLCRSSVRGFSFAIDPMGFRAQWAHHHQSKYSSGRENIKYIYSFAHVIYADYLNFLYANLWHITQELRIMFVLLFSFPLMPYDGWRFPPLSLAAHLPAALFHMPRIIAFNAKNFSKHPAVE